MHKNPYLNNFFNFLQQRKFGKLITVISGIDNREINLKDLTKKLKSRLACGGTVKKNIIELQGEHAQKTKQVLIELGFNPETIKFST